MIIYLHGYDSDSSGNHKKILQLQCIDSDVRLISYSTQHPRHDMRYLLTEVDKLVRHHNNNNVLICGVGLGGYWAERVGFLCGVRQAIFNPNLFPQENMQGKIDRPEEYADIATKCVEHFRLKNRQNCVAILSRNDEALNIQRVASELEPYYPVIWDEKQSHKFEQISHHLAFLKNFKEDC